ncbi:hypothetical protein SDC9_196212 [bioreactor metagenome]|uniref:Uncharacterized protein n=1 Tax=bioreactor metagenome TaxID=1076179 RepID=A0A645ICP9_9ZZZZ
MSREGDAHRKVGCLRVADLSDHYYVGVLAQDRTEGAPKGEADPLVYLYLCEAGDRKFDGVLQCDDIL